MFPLFMLFTDHCARNWRARSQRPPCKGRPAALAASPFQGEGAKRLRGFHRLVTGYTPCGRHSKMATINAMFENSATLGARNPV